MSIVGKKVLVVEDDLATQKLVFHIFAKERAHVQIAADGEHALRLFYAWQPDVVILDVRLPRKSGWEVCRQMQLFSDAPIVFLTVADSEKEIVRGLTCGASDYVTKPFSARILLARVEAVLRDVQGENQQIIPKTTGFQDDYLTIDLDNHQILVDQKPIHLTKTEYHLLTILVRHLGQVLTHQQILNRVWGWDNRSQVSNVHVLISRLRQKLEPNPRNPRYLQLEYGIGYRFVP